MTEAQSDPDTTIAIVYVVSNSAETATRLDQTLTEAGIGASVVHVPQAQNLGEAVSADKAAILCLQAGVDDLDNDRLLGLAVAVAPRAPVLILDSDPLATHARWVEGGAFDAVAFDQPALLQRRLEQAVKHAVCNAELSQTQRRLGQAQRRLDVLLSQSQEAEAGLKDGLILNANSAFALLFGFVDAEAANGTDFLTLVAPADRERVAETFAQLSESRADTTLVFDGLTRSGKTCPVRALLHRGISEDSERRHINLVMQPVEPNAPRETVRQVNHDGRLALHRVLAAAAARDQERVAGLIFVAVDEIAVLQTRVGVAHSDLLLQEAGLFLLQGLRDLDRCFRFGAGEYVLLIERHSRGEIRDVAERLHQGLSSEVFGDDTHSATLTISMAWTALTGDAGDNDRRLLVTMQKAYALRDNGGNACELGVDEQGDGGESVSVRRWVTLLKQGLEQDRFSLAYQAITSLAGDSQPYFDVLIRYIDDRGGLVRAAEFMPAADQAGMMPDIDRWVTQRAVDVIWQQRAKDQHMALFIKLSSATLAAGDDFTQWLERTIASRPFDRSNILFCVREDDLRAQTESAQKLCQEVTRLGCRVAITHYGSTPKALQLLDAVPASFIKLAPDFARQVLGGDQDERLARVISGAKERGIPLIAEHIEDANSMAHLWQAGVNYVQGHFIQEPDTQALAENDSGMV